MVRKEAPGTVKAEVRVVMDEAEGAASLLRDKYLASQAAGRIGAADNGYIFVAKLINQELKAVAEEGTELTDSFLGRLVLWMFAMRVTNTDLSLNQDCLGAENMALVNRRNMVEVRFYKRKVPPTKRYKDRHGWHRNLDVS
jgi:hypothetical protein